MRVMRPALAALFTLAFAARAFAAPTAAVVDVRLEDPSTGNGLTIMHLAIQPDRVKAGQVAFRIANLSKDLTHEMLLVRLLPRHTIPYDPKTQRVVEDRVNKLVDSGDIAPGGSKTVAVTLGPGNYLAFCNEPGHYAHGMRATFNTTR